MITVPVMMLKLQKPQEHHKSQSVTKGYRASDNPDADSFGALKLDGEHDEGGLHWRHITDISAQRDVSEMSLWRKMCAGERVQLSANP